MKPLASGYLAFIFLGAIVTNCANPIGWVAIKTAAGAYAPTAYMFMSLGQVQKKRGVKKGKGAAAALLYRKRLGPATKPNFGALAQGCWVVVTACRYWP